MKYAWSPLLGCRVGETTFDAATLTGEMWLDANTFPPNKKTVIEFFQRMSVNVHTIIIWRGEKLERYYIRTEIGTWLP